MYLVEKDGKRVLHLTDTGVLPEESISFLASLQKHIDLITFDCTFLWEAADPGARHMNLAEDMRTFGRLAACGVADSTTKKVITHFSHNSAPSEEALARAQKEYGVIAAYDGLTLEI